MQPQSAGCPTTCPLQRRAAPTPRPSQACCTRGVPSSRGPTLPPHHPLLPPSRVASTSAPHACCTRGGRGEEAGAASPASRASRLHCRRGRLALPRIPPPLPVGQPCLSHSLHHLTHLSPTPPAPRRASARAYSRRSLCANRARFCVMKIAKFRAVSIGSYDTVPGTGTVPVH